MNDEGTCYRKDSQCRRDEKSSLEELFCMAVQTCGVDAGAVSPGELMQAEHDTLYQFARSTGIGRTQDEFKQTCASGGFCSNGGGNEHDVLIQPSGRRVLKITQPGNGYGARSRLTDYLENHLMANILFGDDIRVEYIVYGTRMEDMPMIVVSQPFIEGTRAGDEEISSFWESFDFKGCGPHAYRHPCGTTIYDARPDNIYRSSDGYLFPIDVQVLHGMQYLRYKLLQMLAGQA